MITTSAVAERDENAPPLVAETWLPRSELSPARARKLLTDLLERVDGGERFSENGRVVVTELVSNAVAHGTERGKKAFVHLEADAGHLLVEVHDASENEPVLRELAITAETGRGMQLVTALAESWGWRLRTPGIGKVVWAIVLPAQGGN
ncbi:ATP-binding protein [Kitasatospora viridis]|uniref:Histidine kinase-like protein n=1 Tax=Kitasatospora viridis TaxID=281105 RepID=A0A561UL17_9ACTN|nr:ATP-binding protein [Kitasatospora viridis]TWG00047.1 histidine kinase-like protein [Kitasatospora viridis]